MKTYEELFESIEIILGIETVAFGKLQNIQSFVDDIRADIERNRKLLIKNDEQSKLRILKIFFRDIIQKGVPGETCLRVEKLLDEKIKSFEDLKVENYKFVMNNSGYRFPNDFTIWDEMKKIIENKFKWDWLKYINLAEENYHDNFRDDPFLKIKGVGINVRNLALSNFSPYFPKIDKHVGEVFSRLQISKLVIGKDIPPSWYKTEKLQPLFVAISSKCNKKYSETDLDRIFWHFGREICTDKPQCNRCKIRKYCSIPIH